MGFYRGPHWFKLPDTLRFEPAETPKLLIQVESKGYDDTSANRRQRIVIDGSEVLSGDAGRSYKVTRLEQDGNGRYTFDQSNNYDVYGSADNGTEVNSFLNTFNDGDLVVINTHDEPNNNRGQFKTNLINNFGARLQDSSVWESRCSYILVAVKGRKTPIYEQLRPRYTTGGSFATLYVY